MQVVSTVIGSTIALLFGWALLPCYGSQRMLRDQAAALAAALRLLRAQHAAVAAAAGGGRAVAAAGWPATVEREIQVRSSGPLGCPTNQ